MILDSQGCVDLFFAQEGFLRWKISMNDFDFSLEQQKRIQHLAFLYRNEAEKCFSVKAYLSGCILIGAAFEALLLSTINSFPELVLNAKNTPKNDGKIKKLERWSLGELITVAKEIGWLPSDLYSEEKWKIVGINTEDYFEVVQRIRNLIHPARYTKEFGRKRITKKHLIICFNIVNNAANFLYQSLRINLGILKKENKKRKAMQTKKSLF